ncbi:zinc finger X-linked protein ZXDB-like [Alligator mississippiensis]|uniref:zinc finger X-linked protein ZXDB-like n=1 Tax=Alligator mississippiensis TaxID=8496 RepID=UPI002877F434|nr:zinc finger X-linked protein ZXDB-like [Alligator mississippiensis]
MRGAVRAAVTGAARAGGVGRGDGRCAGGGCGGVRAAVTGAARARDAGSGAGCGDGRCAGPAAVAAAERLLPRRRERAGAGSGAAGSSGRGAARAARGGAGSPRGRAAPGPRQVSGAGGGTGHDTAPWPDRGPRGLRAPLPSRRFVSFSPAAELDAALTHVLAALLALGAARLCGLLRPVPRALRRAWRDGAASALALLVLPLGSALAGTVMLSWRPAASRAAPRASASLLRLLAGSGDHAAVCSLDPAPAALLAGCSLASLVCLLLGLVSALPAACAREEAAQEPALVLELQLLLRDFRSLLGILHPAPPRPEPASPAPAPIFFPAPPRAPASQ